MTTPTENSRSNTPAPHDSTWQDVHAILTQRIRAKWRALAHLNPDSVDWDTIESRLASASEPEGLFALLDHADRQLDSAFKPQSRRATTTSKAEKPDARSFK